MVSSELSELVKEHQVHVCNDQLCEACSNPQLPSLETIITLSCSHENLESAKMFKMCMMGLLKNMSLEQKKTMSTFDWLELVWLGVTGEITEENVLIVSFGEEEDKFRFEIDERLSSYMEEYPLSPLTALYQYALSVCNEGDDYNVVLKRLKIVESFTKPFSPLFLKSCNSSMLIELVQNCKVYEELVSRSKEKLSDRQNQTDPKLIFSHKEVSLQEAIFLHDKAKKRIKTSTTVEFINAVPTRRMMFKKVNTDSDDNFKL